MTINRASTQQRHVSDIDNKSGDFKKFNPNEITHVYHVGKNHTRPRPYGRTNNQIITILHALDLALDHHGDPPNNHAVVALSGWAF